MSLLHIAAAVGAFHIREALSVRIEDTLGAEGVKAVEEASGVDFGFMGVTSPHPYIDRVAFYKRTSERPDLPGVSSNGVVKEHICYDASATSSESGPSVDTPYYASSRCFWMNEVDFVKTTATANTTKQMRTWDNVRTPATFSMLNWRGRGYPKYGSLTPRTDLCDDALREFYATNPKETCVKFEMCHNNGDKDVTFAAQCNVKVVELDTRTCLTEPQIIDQCVAEVKSSSSYIEAVAGCQGHATKNGYSSSRYDFKEGAGNSDGSNCDPLSSDVESQFSSCLTSTWERSCEKACVQAQDQGCAVIEGHEDEFQSERNMCLGPTSVILEHHPTSYFMEEDFSFNKPEDGSSSSLCQMKKYTAPQFAVRTVLSGDLKWEGRFFGSKKVVAELQSGDQVRSGVLNLWVPYGASNFQQQIILWDAKHVGAIERVFNSKRCFKIVHFYRNYELCLPREASSTREKRDYWVKAIGREIFHPV
jgi:hypothetical protein